MTDFIKEGERYTDRSGGRGTCVAISNGIAFLVFDEDPNGYARQYLLNGSHLNNLTPHAIDPPKPEPMQPPWSVLPDWVTYVATDGDGNDFCHEYMPTKENEQWVTPGGDMENITFLKFPRGTYPWHQSLVKRPEGE